MDRATLERFFVANRDRFVSEWSALLRFPSISTDPARGEDCTRCARWLADHLAGLGFAARLLPTASKPVLFAERKGAPGRPVVLFYGHYDVQPVDPLDAWMTPPFEPALRGDRLYARGAADNKGQHFYVLKAMEALIAAGAPLPTIKVIIEGEEECGSGGIAAALPSWRDFVRADVLMVTDVGAGPGGAPAIIMGLRGIVTLTVTLSGPLRDLHSGTHGGVAPNPATAMARLVASLHHPDGRIAVKDFGEGLREPTPEERRLANAAPLDAGLYRELTGVPPVAGEPGFTPAERLGFRPAIDINGIHAGYGGPGSKTIIPAVATAKISARLASAQDPARCLDAIVRHLRAHAPEGLRLEVTEQGNYGPPLRLDPASARVALARSALAEVSGEEPAFLWEGASIPILSRLAEVSGAEPILAGMSREEDNIHAPNESFSLSQFEQGFLYAGLLLARL